jgi:hypothetical protein
MAGLVRPAAGGPVPGARYDRCRGQRYIAGQLRNACPAYPRRPAC